MKSLCIFFEIDKGMSTSNQFRCEIERPFTNLNEISTKLAGKTYTKYTELVVMIIVNANDRWDWSNLS